MESLEREGPRPEINATEASPLLGTSNHADRNHPWYSPKRYHPATLIIPVALAFRLAATLPSTTVIYIVNQVVCRQYYLANDPDRIPPTGPLPDELCDAAAVKQIFSMSMTALTILAAIGGMIAFSTLSHFTSRYGRKPGLLVVIGLQISSALSLIISQYSPPTVEVVLLVVWLLADCISTLSIGTFLINLYIVDSTDVEKRTTTLSSILGWTALGGAIAFSLGGTLTTRSKNIFLVFWVSVAIMTTTFLYVLFIIPESFSAQKRLQLQQERAEQRAKRNNQLQGARGSVIRFIYSIGSAFEPLKELKPTVDSRTGKRNWRLIICAFHGFLSELGTYSSVANMITYSTAVFKYKPATTGYLLTIVSLTGVAVLMFMLPIIIRILQPLYSRRRLNPQGDFRARDRLDVHISMVSLVFEAVASFLYGQATNLTGHIVAIVFWGFGTGRTPAFRSVVVASVEPLRQGNTLAAIEMVSSIGSSLSPVMMGTILTATIATVPSTVFWVNGITLLIASSVFLLIQESPYEQTPQDRNQAG